MHFDLFPGPAEFADVGSVVVEQLRPTVAPNAGWVVLKDCRGGVPRQRYAPTAPQVAFVRRRGPRSPEVPDGDRSRCLLIGLGCGGSPIVHILNSAIRAVDTVPCP